MTITQSANDLIAGFEDTLALTCEATKGPFFAGVDLGTANIVTAVVDTSGVPVAGVLTRSRSTVRDGLVLDYMGAITILRQQVNTLKNAGYNLDLASAAFPPGTTGRNCETFANVLRAVGLEVAGLIDEPSAAALVLDIREGAVVDVGGGTTGISVLQDGQVIYTADEATGGLHLDLVIAGHYKISVEDAEKMKNDPKSQSELFSVVRPVFQKMASIVRQHLRGHQVKDIYLVGGTSCFPGMDKVMADETQLEVFLPHNPLLVTPLGIALSCSREARNLVPKRKAASK
ncbi:MAG: ethanolamine utilization protein EutJ [Deltaproteobacteria bacterium]|nr:ethanolamine utilization protein EutJ [Deltaproteobacteria bacterium]